MPENTRPTASPDAVLPPDSDEDAELDVIHTPFMAKLAETSSWRARQAERWRPAFLAALMKSPAVTIACRAAQIDFKTYRRHFQGDEVFHDACVEAERFSHDLLLQSAWEDAVVGYEKPVYQGGQKVGTILERSDTMRAMLLKAFLPGRFDRAQELVINGGHAMPHLHATPEEIRRLVIMNQPELFPEEHKKLKEEEAREQLAAAPNTVPPP